MNIIREQTASFEKTIAKGISGQAKIQIIDVGSNKVVANLGSIANIKGDITNIKQLLICFN